jgi:hypothetical protein
LGKHVEKAIKGWIDKFTFSDPSFCTAQNEALSHRRPYAYATYVFGERCHAPGIGGNPAQNLVERGG